MLDHPLKVRLPMPNTTDMNHVTIKLTPARNAMTGSKYKSISPIMSMSVVMTSEFAIGVFAF
jgi:hypothetical protein